MTSGELITRVQQEFKTLANRFVTVDFNNAVISAQEDTGWTLPQTSEYRLRWLISRTKRYLYEMLLSESAHKFKVDGINLQHRFDHYIKLLEMMDKEWEKEQEGLMDDGLEASTGIAGVKITTGFVYDRLGKDISGDRSSTIYPSSED